jgi:hypothetical protein
VVRAGLHQGGRDPRVGPGGGAIGRGRGGLTDSLRLGGHRLRECPDDLAERGADIARRIAGVVMAVKHRHDQPEGLVGTEHQRREPQAAADAVAAVGPTDRLDRDAGLAQNRDVPPGGPLGDPELVGEPVRGDSRAALDEFERQQRSRRRADFWVHGGALSGS